MNQPLQTEVTEKALQQISRAEEEYQRASALVVSSQSEYDEAGEYIAGLKRYKKKLDDERKELVDPLNQHVKKINQKFKPHLENIDRAIKGVNSKMIGFFQEQERKRRQAEAAAAEKARKERERLEDRAAKAQEKGQEEKAAALQEQAQYVQAPIGEVETTKQTSETTIVETWSAKVFDKLALIEAVAKGEASMNLLDANMPALNQMARAQKDTLKLPGVKAECTKSVRAK